MIRHICMFKLKEENKQANLQEALHRAQSLKAIEQVRGFEVVCNGPDMPESNYELALIFDFESAETLQAYQEHPVHQAFGKLIGQYREDRACIDYYFDA